MMLFYLFSHWCLFFFFLNKHNLNLFSPIVELKASSPTIRYEEPPLFLCLKVGKPKNTKVTYEAPFSTYGKAKKPEYWFTVSQEK